MPALLYVMLITVFLVFISVMIMIRLFKGAYRAVKSDADGKLRKSLSRLLENIPFGESGGRLSLSLAGGRELLQYTILPTGALLSLPGDKGSDYMSAVKKILKRKGYIEIEAMEDPKLLPGKHYYLKDGHLYAQCGRDLPKLEGLIFLLHRKAFRLKNEDDIHIDLQLEF